MGSMMWALIFAGWWFSGWRWETGLLELYRLGELFIGLAVFSAILTRMLAWSEKNRWKKTDYFLAGMIFTGVFGAIVAVFSVLPVSL